VLVRCPRLGDADVTSDHVVGSRFAGGRRAVVQRAPGRAVLERSTRRYPLPLGLALAAGAILLVALPVVRSGLRLPAAAGEARLVDAASAVLQVPGAAPASAGLDELAARVQLSTYVGLTDAVDRHAVVLPAARELALVACVALLVSVIALARSLGVRPPAVAVVLAGLAVCPPAVETLTVLGPGLLGAAWLTVGAALLARDRSIPVRVLGVAAVVVAVATAPVLAVPVAVTGAALAVAVRHRRSALVVGAGLVTVLLPLTLLPAPAGPAAVPALVVAVVLVGLVSVDEAAERFVRRPRRSRTPIPGV
jgi:hypothetical protein